MVLTNAPPSGASSFSRLNSLRVVPASISSCAPIALAANRDRAPRRDRHAASSYGPLAPAFLRVWPPSRFKRPDSAGGPWVAWAVAVAVAGGCRWRGTEDCLPG
jgi:hypothetical protein